MKEKAECVYLNYERSLKSDIVDFLYKHGILKSPYGDDMIDSILITESKSGIPMGYFVYLAGPAIILRFLSCLSSVTDLFSRFGR